MYFWNVKALIEELRTGNLLQKEKMKYYLLTTLIPTILVELYMSSPWEINSIKNVNLFIVIFANIIGILLCFEANRLGDNKDFIERMICLSVPIGFRLTIMFLIIYPPILLMKPLLINKPLSSDLFRLVIVFLEQLLYFGLLRYYILDVSGANRKNDTITLPTA
ncbi:hypothetical protein [Sporomusa sphaeroides]|jgi:hypothetical protein|uniref:hypothetical protein n=1 Tax=Sporomusa sphaeroides TaxID=47679 RepID=UPI0031583CF3